MLTCPSPTPCGVGGLKFSQKKPSPMSAKSHPMRGGWIEIFKIFLPLPIAPESHPMRGGWIEIPGTTAAIRDFTVPPHAGWVD